MDHRDAIGDLGDVALVPERFPGAGTGPGFVPEKSPIAGWGRCRPGAGQLEASETGPSLLWGGLWQGAVDRRVHAQVVQRPGEHGDQDGRCLGARDG